jgi:hypothetical protein
LVLVCSGRTAILVSTDTIENDGYLLSRKKV